MTTSARQATTTTAADQWLRSSLTNEIVTGRIATEVMR